VASAPASALGIPARIGDDNGYEDDDADPDEFRGKDRPHSKDGSGPADGTLAETRTRTTRVTHDGEWETATWPRDCGLVTALTFPLLRRCGYHAPARYRSGTLLGSDAPVRGAVCTMRHRTVRLAISTSRLPAVLVRPCSSCDGPIVVIRR
jgi:hypothetical protein